MSERDGRGQRVAEGDVAYRKGIVAAAAYAALGKVMFEEVAALLMVEQCGVLTDGDVKSDVPIVIPLGMEEKLQAALLYPMLWGDGIGERVGMSPSVVPDGEEGEMSRVAHAVA